MGVKFLSQEEWNKKYGSGSGSGSGNTGNNGTNPGGTYQPYNETADVKQAKENFNSGNFGSSAGAGTFGDYLSWSAAQGNNTLGMSGDQMIGVAGMAGTDKDSKVPAGPTYADYQAASATYDKLHGMSTSDLIDYYMSQDAGAYEKDQEQIDKGQAYLSSRYQSASDNKDSSYSQDVATRISENKDDIDNIIKWVYEEAEKNGWNDAQINDVLGYVAEGQNSALTDAGYDLSVWRGLYDEYKDTEVARMHNINAGGNGVLESDITDQGDELYDFLGTKGSSGDSLIAKAEEWQDKTGASDEQMEKLFSYIDSKEYGAGNDSDYLGLWKAHVGGGPNTPEAELADLSEKFYGAGGTAENPQGGLLNDYITEFKMNPGDTDVNDTEAVIAVATGMMLQDVQAGDDVLKGLYTPEEVSGKSQDEIDDLVCQRIQDIEDPELKRVAEIAYGYHRMNYIIDSKEARTEAEGAEKQQSYSATADGYKALKSPNGGTQFDDARESITKALTNDLNSLDAQYEAYLREVLPTLTDEEISVEKQKYSGVSGMEKNPYFNGFVGYMIRKGYFSNGAANMQGYYSQNQGTPFDMSTVSGTDPYIQDLLNRTYETVR